MSQRWAAGCAKRSAAIALEGLGAQLFERIDGDYFAILGLPLLPLMAFLRSQGGDRAMTISGAAKLAGVMGWPVAHSRSPALHGFWLAEHGIDGAYLPLPVRPENLRRALQALPLMGFAGCNLTIPHKEPALEIVDEIDASARRAGAINMVVIDEHGRLRGGNSDGFGFLEALRAAVPGWSARAGAAVVLGAGGAARAIVAALIDDGAPEIRLVNRTPARAASLAKTLGGAVWGVPWERRAEALAGAALLVNATSLGMAGQPALELALDLLPPGAVVNDIVYVPLETPLLAAARARGNLAVDGLDMLLHQARPGFAAWFGVAPAVTQELRRAAHCDLAAVKIIGLTGSIGMGKSTAAAMLKHMRLPVFDADAAVHGFLAPGGAAVDAVERAFPGIKRHGGDRPPGAGRARPRQPRRAGAARGDSPPARRRGGTALPRPRPGRATAARRHGRAAAVRDRRRPALRHRAGDVGAALPAARSRAEAAGHDARAPRLPAGAADERPGKAPPRRPAGAERPRPRSHLAAPQAGGPRGGKPWRGLRAA